MIVGERGKSSSHSKNPVLNGLEVETLIEALQVGYDATKEGVKNSLCNLVG